MTTQPQPQLQPQPRKTDPDDMSRPGPITFLIIAGVALVYVGVSYGDQILSYLGLR